MFVAAALSGAISCAQGSESPGQLVVSIETDMAVPEQLDNIRVQVLLHGRAHLDDDYMLGGGSDEVKLPATLTLVAGSDPAQSVTVRVAGSKQGLFRTFREVTTTVPQDRVAHLRMPLQWLCDGTARSIGADPTSRALRSTCDDDHSCVAGRCVPSARADTSLSDFVPGAVYGGGPTPAQGKCFDTLPCLVTGSLVEPSEGDCSFTPPQWANLNVGLRVAGGGICDDSGTICFVPLDAKSEEGWRPLSDGRRVQLPGAVCDKLRLGLIRGVYVSTHCPTKTAADPPCGEWSSVTTKGRVPSASELAKASSVRALARFDRERDGSVCCPLLSDGNSLYTCTCVSDTEARVQRIDPSGTSRPTVIASVRPPNGSNAFAATLVGRELYWGADRAIVRQNLDSGVIKRWPLNTTVFSDAPLLHDSAALSALANREEGTKGSPVQVLRIAYDGAISALDTGGNQPILQFAQSEDALFVATGVDVELTAGVSRDSTVVRLSKRDGAAKRLVSLRQVQTSNRDRGGYIGVQAGASTLFALFESAPEADGSSRVQLQRLDPSGASTEPAAILQEQTVSFGRSRVLLLGVVGDTPVLARVQLETNAEDTTDVYDASIYAVSEAGAVRPLAELKGDVPQQGLIVDDEHFYVSSVAGAVFSITRGGLP